MIDNTFIFEYASVVYFNQQKVLHMLFNGQNHLLRVLVPFSITKKETRQVYELFQDLWNKLLGFSGVKEGWGLGGGASIFHN